MAQLEPQQQTLDSMGAGLVYIAAEKREGVWNPVKYLTEHPVAFPFLLDEDRTVTKAYGLYHALSHEAFRIAYPATLIVNRAGMIRYIYRGTNQMDRAPMEEIQRVLRAL